VSRTPGFLSDSPVITEHIDSSKPDEGGLRPVRSVFPAIVVTAIVMLAALPLSAQAPTEDRDESARVQTATRLNVPARKIVLRAKDTIEHTYVRPRVAIGRLPGEAEKAFTPATFVVTYTGFSPAAEAAFQAAVDIWSQLISSPVPIRVNAVWEPLEVGVLGQAGPNGYLINVTNGIPGVVYPAALADALAGVDQGAGAFDISASFNSTFPDWYLGTDGLPPSGKYDLVSVVLHELCHGLGFLGSATIDDGADTDECDGFAGHGCWQFTFGPDTVPIAFDTFTEDNLGIALRDAGTFPNNSVALGNVLTGMDVFFDGPNANTGNGGSPPELYAPGTFEYGSSYSHLDETVYGSGHPSSLMTPYLGANEVIHDPGAITLGIFDDIGWEVAGAIFADGFESGDLSRWSSSVP